MRVFPRRAAFSPLRHTQLIVFKINALCANTGKAWMGSHLIRSKPFKPVKKACSAGFLSIFRGTVGASAQGTGGPVGCRACFRRLTAIGLSTKNDGLGE